MKTSQLSVLDSGSVFEALRQNRGSEPKFWRVERLGNGFVTLRRCSPAGDEIDFKPAYPKDRQEKTIRVTTLLKKSDYRHVLFPRKRAVEESHAAEAYLELDDEDFIEDGPYRDAPEDKWWASITFRIALVVTVVIGCLLIFHEEIF